MSRYRVSMDIGGTFTDVVAYDEQSRDATPPARRRRRRHDLTEGVLAGLEQVVGSPGDIALHRPRHDAGPERLPAAPRRARAAARHARRRRRLPHRPRQPDAALRRPLPQADAAGAARATSSRSAGGSTTPARSSSRSTRTRCAPPLAAPARRASARSPSPSSSPTSTPSTSCAPRRSCARSSTASRSRCRTASRASGASTSARRRPSSTPTSRRSCAATSSAWSPSCATAGSSVPLHVMQSSGGIVTAESARELTLQTLLSGPVGGTMGGVALARLLDRPNLICIDMGGTSFDVSLVVDGAARRLVGGRARGLPAADAGRQHPHDRRRRRLARLRRGGRPARRARERGRRPRARVLRARRDAADGDRRQPGARPRRRGELRRRAR